MHTLIFEVVKDLVEEKHGEEVWKDLASKAGLPSKLEKDFYYSDSLIYELVKHASEALSVPAEAILELVGYWFIVYIKKSEYGKLLNMAGTTLAETLQNINSLHGHMKLSYFKHLSPPTFRTTNVTATSLRLHYIPGKSTRTSLAPLVIGLVKGLAETHFEIPESKLKILLLKSADKGADHDVFHVSWKKAVMEDKKSPTELKQTRNYQIGVDGDGLNRIFPFHFVVNKKLQIVQQGSSLRKLAQIENDELMRNKMEVRSPNIIDNYSYKILEKLVGEPITLRLRVGKKFVDLSMEIIKIRGEKDRSVLCFVGSPILRSMKESLDLGLSLSDFAVHDPAKDRLFAFDHADNLHQKIIQSSFSDTDSDLSDSSLRDMTIPELVAAKPTNSSPLPNMLDQIGGKNAQRAPSCPYNVKLISQKITPLDIRPAMKDELMSPRSTSPPSSPRSPIHNPSFLLNLMEKDAQNKFVFTKSIVGKMQADSNIKTTTTALIKIHESFGKVNDLLNEAVNWEMQNCVSASQMFRQDNASTCIISSFCREKSKKVVKKLLMQLISNLSHQNQKNSDNDNIEVIKTATIQFLNDLISSAPSWPYEVARLISFISREVSEKKNFEFANCSINSIIFLRLLSPAIVFPTQFDIPPSKTLIETQKSLLTVSRIINNIINRMNFNNDSNLREFNDIINSRENEEKIDRFIHLLVEHSSNSPPFRLFPLNNCYAMDLRNFLADRFDELLELSHNNPEIKTFIRDIALPQIRA